jgi:hypothetical protein
MDGTVDIPKRHWSRYLDGISRTMANADLSIEVVDEGWPPAVEADRLTLQFLAYDQRDELFEVAGEPGASHQVHVFHHLVDRPRRIAASRPTATPRRIEIEGADGLRTVIRLTDPPA